MPATTDIEWDTLPPPVRDFLAAVPEDVTIRRNGSPIRRVFSPVPPTADGEWTDAKNERRCQLIDRMIDGTLTPEEGAELADLRRQLRRHVNAVAPLPLAEARQLHQQLLDLAARNRAGEPT